MQHLLLRQIMEIPIPPLPKEALDKDKIKPTAEVIIKTLKMEPAQQMHQLLSQTSCCFGALKAMAKSVSYNINFGLHLVSILKEWSN